jgi:hypothetical protein
VRFPLAFLLMSNPSRHTGVYVSRESVLLTLEEAKKQEGLAYVGPEGARTVQTSFVHAASLGNPGIPSQHTPDFKKLLSAAVPSEHEANMLACVPPDSDEVIECLEATAGRHAFGVAQLALHLKSFSWLVRWFEVNSMPRAVFAGLETVALPPGASQDELCVAVVRLCALFAACRISLPSAQEFSARLDAIYTNAPLGRGVLSALPNLALAFHYWNARTRSLRAGVGIPFGERGDEAFDMDMRLSVSPAFACGHCASQGRVCCISGFRAPCALCMYEGRDCVFGLVRRLRSLVLASSDRSQFSWAVLPMNKAGVRNKMAPIGANPCGFPALLLDGVPSAEPFTLRWVDRILVREFAFRTGGRETDSE